MQTTQKFLEDFIMYIDSSEDENAVGIVTLTISNYILHQNVSLHYGSRGISNFRRMVISKILDLLLVEERVVEMFPWVVSLVFLECLDSNCHLFICQKRTVQGINYLLFSLCRDFDTNDY